MPLAELELLSAPIIGACVGALVAIAVFLGTQFAIHLRERHNFLRGKLEDLYSLGLQLGRRNGDRYNLLTLKGTDTIAVEPLTLHQFVAMDLLEPMRLLVTFYFPSLEPELMKVYKANASCTPIWDLIKSDTFQTYRSVPKNEFANALTNLKNLGDVADDFRTAIMNQRGVLTKNPLAALTRWWDGVTNG